MYILCIQRKNNNLRDEKGDTYTIRQSDRNLIYLWFLLHGVDLWVLLGNCLQKVSNIVSKNHNHLKHREGLFHPSWIWNSHLSTAESAFKTRPKCQMKIAHNGNLINDWRIMYSAWPFFYCKRSQTWSVPRVVGLYFCLASFFGWVFKIWPRLSNGHSGLCPRWPLWRGSIVFFLKGLNWENFNV